MSEIDLTLALQLQAQFEEELRVSLLKQQEEKNKQNEDTAVLFELHDKKKIRKPLEEPQQGKLSVSLTDPTWELIDPNPDIHTLFLTFNDQFFWGRLAGIEVRWSPRMTLCAGVCCYEGRGGLCSVRLSLPLLKLRPRKDLVETLLHEMIHAYLFVIANNKDRDGHGPEFHKHMYRINNVAGTNISVFHTFHDEVDVYRQHIWQCNGPCRTKGPYFGLLKRSMNRVPGPKDNWWDQHLQTCGGTYIKIQEPDRSQATKKETRIAGKNNIGSCSDIRKYVGFKGKSNSLGGATSKAVHSKENSPVGDLKRKIESGSKHNLEESKEKQNKVRGFASTSSEEVNQIKVAGASQSNVHGFGSHSPLQKKPCDRKISGSKTIVKRNPGSHGTISHTVRKSGSQIVTVKGKTGTQTETHVKESNREALYNTFQGQGYTLGGSTIGKQSKLLSLSASNSMGLLQMQMDSESEVHLVTESVEGNVIKKRQKSLDCYFVTPSSLEANEKTVRCPVCNATMPERDINKHLDDCVGNLSDEDVMNDISKEGLFKGIPSTSGDEIICTDNGGELSQTDLQKCCENEESKHYLCPVCGEWCLPATINQHLDTHF